MCPIELFTNKQDLKKTLFLCLDLTDEHYCMMVSNGAFTQTGELNVNSQNLPQIYDEFFKEMLDLFLTFSARSVVSFFWASI
jgi:hypothetical protein